MTEEMVEAGWSDAQADCRRVFEENSHPMWVVEALEVVDVNQAALLHYGYSRDEFLAHDHRRSLRRRAARGQGRPGSARGLADIGGRTDRSSTWRSPRSRSRSAGGRPLWTPSSTSPTAGGRRPRHAISISLLATVTDAVVASDDKFILTGWNAAAESTYGRRAEEVLGQPDALVFRTDFVGVERAEAIKRLLETGRFHGELTHRRGDGKRIHIESRAAALFDSDGKRLGYVSVNRDITERRYAEETIRALLNDVLTAQEAERRRIARELHDETAQTLTSLLVGLRAVEESQDLGQALGAASTLRGLGVGRLAGRSAHGPGASPERARRSGARGGARASGDSR